MAVDAAARLEFFPTNTKFASTDFSTIYNEEIQGHDTPFGKTTGSYASGFMLNKPERFAPRRR